MNIGKSVVIKGELSGSEDLTIEGHVEGRIELRENVLTIGPNGKIRPRCSAKAVIVLGEVVGNVTASEKVDIRDNGSVDGDIVSPRVAIAEGAHFRGSVDMQRGGAKPADAGHAASRPLRPQRRRSRQAASRPGRRSAPESRADVWSRRAHLRDLFSIFGGRRASAPRRALPPRPTCRRTSRPIPPKRSPSFSSSCKARENPALIDLGPVVGSNVTFFGEQLGCRIRVEDVAADIERHVKEGKVDELPKFFATRFPQEAESVDGILCWDVLRLSRSRRPRLRWPGADATAAARWRAARLFQHRRRPRPGLHEIHRRRRHDTCGTAPIRPSRPRQRSLLNRDIIKMFEGLRVTESFLMKNNVREILFRKPAYLSNQCQLISVSASDGPMAAQRVLLRYRRHFRHDHDMRPVVALLSDFGTAITTPAR